MEFPTISHIRGQGIRPVKKRGQNFLIDKNLSQKAITAADISPDDTVLEIGPGPGSLTHFLAATGARIYCFEIDAILYNLLKQATRNDPLVEILNKDILGVNFDDYTTGNQNIIMGSIPYSITTPILLKFFQNGRLFKKAIFIVQKEVAERLCAKPGNRDYGIFSVYCHTYLTASIIQIIPADCFYPRPKVDSAILQLIPLENKDWDSPHEKLFRVLVRAAFSNRRKTLHNSLKSFLHQKGIDAAVFTTAAEKENISLQRRAETLSSEEFYTLTRIAEQTVI